MNPFDLTKEWSHRHFPLVDVGVLELNRNPSNQFAEIEQVADDFVQPRNLRIKGTSATDEATESNGVPA